MLRGIASILLFFVFLCDVAVADTHIPPDKVEISTPIYTANFANFDPMLGTYKYRVSWEGIGAANAYITIERIGMQYHISTDVRTNSFVDIFYKLRYMGSGVVSAVDLLPMKTVIDYKENSREKKANIDFLPNGEIYAARWRNGRGTEVYNFDPKNFTLDPFSAAFMSRSLDWEVGQTREFDTFNGKSRYLITLEAIDKIKMKVNDQERDVLVVSPKVKKLTSSNPKKKLREAKIYITADKYKEILKIESEVFIGSVYTKLVSFTPSTRPVSGRRVVQVQGPQKITLR